MIASFSKTICRFMSVIQQMQNWM